MSFIAQAKPCLLWGGCRNLVEEHFVVAGEASILLAERGLL